MPKLINWDLIREPYNWLIVFLMCCFALTLLALLFPEGGGGTLKRADVAGAPSILGSTGAGDVAAS